MESSHLTQGNLTLLCLDFERPHEGSMLPSELLEALSIGGALSPELTGSLLTLGIELRDKGTLLILKAAN